MHSATLLTLRVPAFEAAIRKAADPGIASWPVVVVTSFKPLGRVLAACPEAQAAGIAEEMHYPAARERCPDAAFFVPDRRLAAEALRMLMERALAYSPLVEPVGGGRILVDTRGTELLWGDSCQTAERLRQDIHQQLHLPAAAGLAVCRSWSLLASRAAGDSGLCHVAPGQEDEFLHQVPAVWVDGITPKTRARLLELNLRSVGQLRQFTRAELLGQFGSACGEALWNAITPQAWDRVTSAAEQMSTDITAEAVRVEAALTEASVVEENLYLVARSLAAQAAATLRARDLGAARLQLTLLYADGAVKSAAARTGGFIQDEAVLLGLAQKLLRRVFVRRVRAVRLWLAAEKLAEPLRQGVLFRLETDAAETTPSPVGKQPETARLLATMDRIRQRYGDASVQPAAMLDPKHPVGKPPSRKRFVS